MKEKAIDLVMLAMIEMIILLIDPGLIFARMACKIAWEIGLKKIWHTIVKENWIVKIVGTIMMSPIFLLICVIAYVMFYAITGR